MGRACYGLGLAAYVGALAWSAVGFYCRVTISGRQPVSNVWVGWEAAMDGLVAETRTDAAGHYRLCGLPPEQITLLAAPAYGNVFSASVDPGSDAIVDFEIARK